MITLLDGATGTALWALADANGVARMPVWKYNLEHPELVLAMHRQYIAAGSQMILSNTFSANGPMVKRTSKYSAAEVVRAGVLLAREASEGTAVKVLCDIGPLSQLMEPYGDLEEDEVDAIFDEMISAAKEAGADGVMAETFIELESACVAARVAKRHGMMTFVSMTFEKVGKTMMGNSVKQVCEAMEEIGVDAVGMNCSLGPVLALPIIEEFARTTKLPLLYKPNAGLPVVDASGRVQVPYTAAQFAREIAPALAFVRYVGGCCNSDPTYIAEIKKQIEVQV